MKGQKVYITKFALEKGILQGTIQEEIRMHSDYPQKEVYLVYNIVTDEGKYLLEQDAFEYDPEKAIHVAESMRNAEIWRLEQALLDLQQMEFVIGKSRRMGGKR